MTATVAASQMRSPKTTCTFSQTTFWDSLSAAEKIKSIDQHKSRELGDQVGWHYAGAVSKKWEEEVYPAISLIINNKQNYDNLFGKSKTRLTRPCALYMVGDGRKVRPDDRPWENARPTIVSISSKRRIAQKISNLLEGIESLKRLNLGFHYMYFEDRRLVLTTAGSDGANAYTHVSPVCGSSILISTLPYSSGSQWRQATMGGIISINETPYGVTAAHAMYLDDTSDDEDEEESDEDRADEEARDRDDEDRSAGLSKVQRAYGDKAAAVRPSSPVPAQLLDLLKGSELGVYKYHHEIKISTNRSIGSFSSSLNERALSLIGSFGLEPIDYTSKSYTSSGNRQRVISSSLDWALFEMQKIELCESNKVKTATSRDIVLTSISPQAPIGPVLLLGGSSGPVEMSTSGHVEGIILPGGSRMVDVWIIETSCLPGDCGSWVVDASAGNLHGMVVASSLGAEETYIVPAKDILDSIRTKWPPDTKLEFPIHPDESVYMGLAVYDECQQEERVTQEANDATKLQPDTQFQTVWTAARSFEAPDAQNQNQNQNHNTSSMTMHLTEQNYSFRPRTWRDSNPNTTGLLQANSERVRSGSRSHAIVQLPTQEHAAASADTAQLKVGQVLCTLIVAYGPEELARLDDMMVEYEEETAFATLHDLAMRKLKEHRKRPAETFYLKTGRCQLLRHDTNRVASRQILESQREWTEDLPSMIMTFRGQNKKVKFHIEVEWKFSSLQIMKVENEPYGITIQDAIEEKMRSNWQKKRYIPRKDLEKILSKDTIFELVKEDASLYTGAFMTRNGGKPLNREEFVEDVWRWASRLLAICIYVDLPLACLHMLRRNGVQDINLPLSEQDCPDACYRTKFHWAVLISGGFSAHTFAANDNEELDHLEHLELSPNTVVPIVFDEVKDFLGQGTFGRVFKVHIDGDHHYFSAYKDEPFALKIFFDRSALTPIDFDNEAETLKRLAEVPHPNITTHLASWKQSKICYMLFRCADCNLRTYMKQLSPPPPLTKHTLLSIFSQMRGLADGVRHIHNLGPSKLEPDPVDEKAEFRAQRRSQSCFHHDLKPGNILVFINPDTGDLRFSIGDFGSARIGSILSGSLQPSPFIQNLSPCDAIYSAPDAVIEGKTSRPYDLWSMGCIFLELLTWILDLEDSNLVVFAVKRLEISNTNASQDQAFWYQDRKGKVQLKPAVVQQMKSLKEKCEGKGVFPALLRIIGKLLSVLPSDRPEASQLFSDLDAIFIQLQRDLKNENFYIDNMPTEVRLAAPPSSGGESDHISRRPSIGERRIPARYKGSRSLDPNAHRRLIVGSVHQSGARRIPSVHTRNRSPPNANINPRYLPPIEIDTRVDPARQPSADEPSNTPRKSLSDFGDGFVRRDALFHMGSILSPVHRTTSSDSETLITA